MHVQGHIVANPSRSFSLPLLLSTLTACASHGRYDTRSAAERGDKAFEVSCESSIAFDSIDHQPGRSWLEKFQMEPTSATGWYLPCNAGGQNNTYVFSAGPHTLVVTYTAGATQGHPFSIDLAGQAGHKYMICAATDEDRWRAYVVDLTAGQACD